MGLERLHDVSSLAGVALAAHRQIAKIVIEKLPQSSRRHPTFRFEQVRPSGGTVLPLDGVSKAYGENQVLCDVSLLVERGDRLAIIGPNGIGKSTLSHHLHSRDPRRGSLCDRTHRT